MKYESILVTLGLLCVAGSIGGVSYVQHLNLRFERQKWELAQGEEKRKAAQETVLAYARDLNSAIRRADAIAAMAKNDPFSLGPQVMADYDKAAMASAMAITNHRLILAAQDAAASRRTEKAAAAYGALDECVVAGLNRVRARDATGFTQLAQCKRQSELASAALQREFVATLTGEGNEAAAAGNTVPSGKR